MNGIMLIRYLISKIRYLWDFLCFCKMLIPVRISPYPPLSQTWNEIQIMHWFSHSDSSCNGGIWNLAAAAAAKSLQSCPTLCNPIDGSPPGSPVPGFSRQEHWSGPPSPPMHESEKRKRSRSVGSNSQRPQGLQPTRLLRPWDFPGKSTGVGCHWNLANLVQILTLLLKMLYHRAILPIDSVI